MERRYRNFVDALPGHLKAHCAEQRYEAYTAEDQEVWRTACGRLADVLADVAAKAALRGFGATGLDAGRIPRTLEIDAALRRFGWRAVTVDGFIPPRAFMEFQARCILPVSRAIRRAEQLDYTPAPDIVHEAAGHAPMLASPRYRAFLRRLGEAGMVAPESALDQAIFRAQRHLSVLSEQPAPDAAALADAERHLADLRRRQEAAPPSPACRIARLHWWTVEYGLVGADAKAFGAGLLSSAGEAAALSDTPRRRLSVACTEQAYDISHLQPFVYVADDWDHLDRVLGQVAAGIAASERSAPARSSAAFGRRVASLPT